MTWSGTMKQRDAGRQQYRARPRYNSRSRNTPSPKILDDRVSPSQVDFPGKPCLAVRISPPPRPADASLSRSPSPQGNAYAGAKFSDPPSPELLPKPPTHWMNFDKTQASGQTDVASQLKMILKVAAQQV